MRYSIGTKVIFWYHNKWLFGVIENRHTVKRGVYTYDVRSEYGSLYVYVPVDEERQIFIDSEKTARIATQIVSNLRSGFDANIRGNEQVQEESIIQTA